MTGNGWYENTDGRGNFGSVQGSSEWHTRPADLDGDGDLDALSIEEEDVITWRQNADGKGTFVDERVIKEDFHEFAKNYVTADLDSDGDVDLLFSINIRWSSEDKIAWLENDGSASFGPEKLVTKNEGRTKSVFSADLDGDGDMDALSTSDEGQIAWYENTDGGGAYSEEIVVESSPGLTALQVAAADIDGDNDLDVLASIHSRFDENGDGISTHSVVWYDNDGTGAFSDPQVILTDSDSSPLAFQAVDLDGDRDIDVMLKSGNVLAWYENVDGSGMFSDTNVIANGNIQSMHTADMDGDGDMDAVISTKTGELGGTIAWFANTDGLGLFSTEPVGILSTAGVAQSVSTADFDGDGDLDVLSAEQTSVVGCVNGPAGGGRGCTREGGGLLWYENTNGAGQLREPQFINTVTSASALAADIDGDGDMDIVEYIPGRPPGPRLTTIYKDKIVWYENTAGHGNFSTERVITTETYGVNSVVTTDVDGDGDLDLLSSSSLDGMIAWYESDLADRKERIPGDADGDGKVAFADFLILSANFGKQVDAVWADGDFNGDGKIEFADFLILSENFGESP